MSYSEVACRQQLLRNTFLHPFRDIPGMARIYRHWEAAGAVFHYVSSSPWPLYGPLREFLDEAGFPAGSIHLRRPRRPAPNLFPLLFPVRSRKHLVLHSIVRMFPRRSFVLVGDSGERDPEIYGAVRRRFPGQIHQIWIRRVAGRRLNRGRLNRVFRGVPPEAWHVFEDPAELLGGC